jgi:hypothetical protein
MITARRLQRNFADGFLAETVEDLWEPRRTTWDGLWKAWRRMPR